MVDDYDPVLEALVNGDHHRARADATIKILELESLIRHWNWPGGSKISSMSDLMIAIHYDRARGDAYHAARTAAPDGIQDFDDQVRFRLEPVILSSFMLAVLEEGRIWASDFARSNPSVHVSRIFDDEDDFVSWAIENLDRPSTICGPEGEDVLEESAVDILLEQALRAERPTAIRAGWFSHPSIVRFPERRPPDPRRL